MFLERGKRSGSRQPRSPCLFPQVDYSSQQADNAGLGPQ